MPDARFTHLLIKLGGIILDLTLGYMCLGPASPMCWTGMSGTCLPASLLWTYLTTRSAYFTNSFSTCTRITLTAFLITLPYHYSVEDIHTYWIVPKCLFGKVECTHFLTSYNINYGYM